ncbi:hypothetical protein QCD61_28370 (plasmid) [Pseudomonas viciae]|uniref:Uncharacterized protein n=1 Tax=Pseudomonas viciae TaxID=2505979 RepID=A0ABY8PME7_9PSED|nr:hypothetical protein [Pseudomonas viciae]WGO96415.1 hypothetical protein QCD61_28370 [Pseudomonas viciae]
MLPWTHSPGPRILPLGVLDHSTCSGMATARKPTPSPGVLFNPGPVPATAITRPVRLPSPGGPLHQVQRLDDPG